MITVNNLVACTPFKKAHNEPVKKGALLMNKQNNTLEKLTVLLDAHIINGEFDAIIKKDSSIYVKGDSYRQPWATTKYPLDVTEDKKIEFILVPFSEILIKE